MAPILFLYLYLLCVTLQFSLQNYKSIALLLQFGLALDFLWPEDYGRSDNVLIPKPGLKRHCTLALTLFWTPASTQKNTPRLDYCRIRDRVEERRVISMEAIPDQPTHSLQLPPNKRESPAKISQVQPRSVTPKLIWNDKWTKSLNMGWFFLM